MQHKTVQTIRRAGLERIPLDGGGEPVEIDFQAELGRLQCLDIGGVAQSVTYDALGRATQSTNALGSFTNAYVDATLRLSTNCFPNGRQTLLSYHGTIDELALGEINWLSPRLGG